MPDWVKAILTNGAVWSAFLLLVNTLLFYFVPDFPREVWASLNGFIIALLAAVGVAGVRTEVRAMRQARARGEYKPPSG